MRTEISMQGCALAGPVKSCLTRLVMEAQKLHLHCHKLVLLCLAAGCSPQDALQRSAEIDHMRCALRDSLHKLRTTEGFFLRAYDPSLAQMMKTVVSGKAERVFSEFDAILATLSAQLAAGDRADHAVLEAAVTALSGDVTTTIDRIVVVAQKVAEAGGADAAKLALTDDLTGLPNRRALNELIAHADSTDWPHDQVVVLQIDLDKLKHINDTLGHAAGDAALVHAAQAMRANASPQDFLARVSGDEFILICFDDLSEREIATRAERLIEHMTLPFIFRGKKCNVSCSIGVARGEKSEDMPLERHVSHADLALYTAKNAGRARYRLFTPHLRTHFEEQEKLKVEIREGLEAGEFESHFQPQVDGRSGRLVGIEALARWNHPKRGLLTPEHFLKAVADSGFRDQLDRYLMRQTLQQMRSWLNVGLIIPQISINLTATRLIEVDLVETLIIEADMAGLPTSMVGLEILESVMIDSNSRQMIDNVHNLSEAGFRVELDDFGTGHASISNLRNFKVDRIKIDRSFVNDVHLHSELAKILAAMIGLAHSLRIDALAEGVETPEERLVLNALGVDHIQGFGVARPMPADGISDWVRKTQKIPQLPPRRKGANTNFSQSVG